MDQRYWFCFCSNACVSWITNNSFRLKSIDSRFALIAKLLLYLGLWNLIFYKSLGWMSFSNIMNTCDINDMAVGRHVLQRNVSVCSWDWDYCITKGLVKFKELEVKGLVLGWMTTCSLQMAFLRCLYAAITMESHAKRNCLRICGSKM